MWRILIFSLLLFPGTAFAAASSGDVSSATSSSLSSVDITNVAILSESPKGITVGFDVENNGDIPQSDIRYGIEIVRTTDRGQTTVDSYVAPETVSLSSKQSSHKELTYPKPSFLSGTYDVWIVSKTSAGLNLGFSNAGKVVLARTGDTIKIAPDSCHLAVAGKTYELLQGVDLTKDEDLSLTCSAVNTSGKTLAVVPSVSTFRRSIYGPSIQVEAPAPTPISFAPGEKKNIVIPIIKAADPQAYDATVSLVRQENATPVSETVFTHYVLRGASATIQNFTLDKATYAQGDSLTATLLWDPSADGFLDSRAGGNGQGTEIKGVAATLSVADAKGQSCIIPVTSDLSRENSVTLTSKVIIACDRPIATLKIIDANGNTLDSRTVPKREAASDTLANPIDSALNNITSLQKGLIFSIVAVLFIVSLGLIAGKIVSAKRRPSRKRGIRMILIPIVFLGSMLSLHGANAVSWNADQIVVDSLGYDWTIGAFGPCVKIPADKIVANVDMCVNIDWAKSYVTFTANTNKLVYTSGEAIVVSGLGQINHCGNHHSMKMTASFHDYPGTTTVLDKQDNYVTGSGILNAPIVSVPTVVTIDLTGTVWQRSNFPWSGDSSLKVTVNPAPAKGTCGFANAVARSAAPSTGLCDAGAASFFTDTGTTFTWSCSGSNGGTSAKCSAPKMVAGECGLSSGPTPVASLTSNSANLCIAGTVASFSGTGPWTWTCSGSNGGASSPTCTALKTQPSVLSLCVVDGGSRSAADFSLEKTSSRTLQAYYGPGAENCNGTDVTADTIFSRKSGNSISVVDPGAGPGLLTGIADGTGVANAEYILNKKLLGTDSITATVFTPCVSDCAAKAASVCQGTTVTGSCGETCQGTRSCDQNWKEVAPTGN